MKFDFTNFSVLDVDIDFMSFICTSKKEKKMELEVDFYMAKAKKMWQICSFSKFVLCKKEITFGSGKEKYNMGWRHLLISKINENSGVGV